jgi:putative transcriptional regulator
MILNMLPRLGVLALIIQAAFGQQPGVGKLLVATSRSHDPDLSRSVVLLIHYDHAGAIGLILNRPTNSATYFGGPIPLGVRALIRSRIQPDQSDPVFPGVWVTSQIEKRAGVFRVYAGYVGWSADQLTNEISRGLWRIRPPDAAAVFDPNPATLWSRLLR